MPAKDAGKDGPALCFCGAYIWLEGGAGKKKKRDRKYRHQGPEVETIQLVREQNPSGQDGWRGATGVCNGEGVF